MHKYIDLENEFNNKIAPYMKPFYSGERFRNQSHLNMNNQI